MSSRNNSARIAIVMGSKSDWATMQFTAEILDALNVPYHVEVWFITSDTSGITGLNGMQRI